MAFHLCFLVEWETLVYFKFLCPAFFLSPGSFLRPLKSISSPSHVKFFPWPSTYPGSHSLIFLLLSVRITTFLCFTPMLSVLSSSPYLKSSPDSDTNRHLHSLWDQRLLPWSIFLTILQGSGLPPFCFFNLRLCHLSLFFGRGLMEFFELLG